MARFSYILILLALPALLAGCGLTGWGQGPSQAERAALARQDELRNKLIDFVTIFADEVKDAAEEIARVSSDSEIDRKSIIWKLRAISSARLNLQRTDDLYAYLDLWSLCLQMTDLFETGEGKDMFGPHQQIAIDTARSLEKRLQGMAQEILDDEIYARAQNEINDFAVAHPMNASFTRNTMSGETGAGGDGESFSWLRTVTGVTSLNPFASGLSEGAAAIQNASVVADRFTSVVATLPEDTRWQLQLLLYDLEDTAMVKSLETSSVTLANSADSLAKTAETFPEQVRLEASKLLEDIDAKQENMRKTLADLNTASVSLKDLSTSFESSSRGIQSMAGALDGSLQTFNQTLGLLLPPADPNAPPKPKPGEPGYSRPFDILDYAKTADAVSVTAGELTKALTEINSTLGDDRLAQIEASAEATMAAAVWDVFYAGLALIAVFFLCLLAYRKLLGT